LINIEPDDIIRLYPKSRKKFSTKPEEVFTEYCKQNDVFMLYYLTKIFISISFMTASYLYAE